MDRFRGAVALLLLFGATACANLNSIRREGSFGPVGEARKGYVTLDAKQRIIVYGPPPTGKSGGTSMAVCAEQAPDVFSVISSSLAGQAGYGANATGTNADAKLAIAMSETGASIRRSQTVNLLALSLFNTCLRYLDGAILPNQFVIQSSRDHQLMIAVLAIEQLTSMGRPESNVVLSSGRSDGSGGSGSVDALVAAKSEADNTASKSVTDATAYTTALADATDTPKTCDTIADATKKAACAKAKETADASAATAKRSEDYYQAVLKGSGGSVAAAAGEGGTPSAVSYATPGTVDKDALIAITAAVRDIALKAMDNDQSSSFCHQLILDTNGNGTSPDSAIEQTLAEQAGCPVAGPIVGGPAPTNTKVAMVVDTATRSTLGSTAVYVQISEEAQRQDAAQIISNLRIALGNAATIYGIDLKPNQSPDRSQIRFFREADRPSAEIVARALAPALPGLCLQYIRYPNVSSDLVELWIGKNGGTIDPMKVGGGRDDVPICS